MSILELNTTGFCPQLVFVPLVFFFWGGDSRSREVEVEIPTMMLAKGCPFLFTLALVAGCFALGGHVTMVSLSCITVQSPSWYQGGQAWAQTTHSQLPSNWWFGGVQGGIPFKSRQTTKGYLTWYCSRHARRFFFEGWGAMSLFPCMGMFFSLGTLWWASLRCYVPQPLSRGFLMHIHCQILPDM